MRNLSLKYSFSLAVISGVLTAFTFPTMFSGFMFPNLGFLAWVSLVPLFFAIYNSGPRRAFLLAFITGLVYYAISLYWLYNALTRYGNISPLGTIILLFFMMVILASFVGLAPAWVSWTRQRWGGSSFYLLPVAWVAVDLIRNYFPAGGFPWNSLGYSQGFYPIFIQLADIFGIYGITFLIVLVNQLFVDLSISLSEDNKSGALVKGAIVVVIFTVVLSYGWYRLETVETRSPVNSELKIALVQGNIAQDEKEGEEFFEENLSVYKNYMEWALKSGVSLAVWPESAYPYVIPLVVDGVKPHILGLDPTDPNNPWLLFGTLMSEGLGGVDDTLYNSAVLVSSNGQIVGKYHKGHLVPFGEYVPYRNVFFFVRKLVDTLGEFKAGEAFLPVSMYDYKLGPLVCYEDVFPEISRSMTINGSDILINITNDAWYGWTSAAYQHLAISVFRAVENRRYVLRATNTGVSAVIDSLGRIELKSGLFEPAFIVSNVPMLKGHTVYDRIGDLFAYLCVIFVLFVTIVVLIKIVIKTKSTSP